MGAKKRLRDEVAELTEAIRALREELAAVQAPHYCHGCHCTHTVYYPNWSGTVTSGGYTVVASFSQGKSLEKP